MDRKFLHRALLATAAVAASGMHIRADTLLSDQLLPELMIEDVAGSALMLGNFFGPDGSSPLSFTSYVNPGALTYSYSLNAGSKYLGQGITFSGSGTFQTTTNTLSMMSSGDLGGTAWNISGTEVVDTSVPDQVDFAIDENFFAAAAKDQDIHCKGGSFNLGTGESTCADGYLTDEDGNKIPNSDFKEKKDNIFKKGDGWHFSSDYTIPGLTLQEVTTGTTPIGGGAGTFTTTISTIPEPSSSALVTLSILIAGLSRRLIGCRRRM